MLVEIDVVEFIDLFFFRIANFFMNNNFRNFLCDSAGMIAILILLFAVTFGFTFQKFFRSRVICIVTTLSVFFSFVFASIQFYFVLVTGKVIYFYFGNWMFFSYLIVKWTFVFDPLCCLMFTMVTFISFLIHVYSIEYMKFDRHLGRFMAYLTLFTFFMIILITSGNLIQIFLGWEGIGLSSYLLIGFWFVRPQASQSALKAMLINRIGDFSLMVAIALCYAFYSTTDLLLLEQAFVFEIQPVIQVVSSEVYVYTIIGLCLIIAGMAKSAQLGLHTWLPDAMEGPTPVSALIHAATLVTAGVFVIVRCSFVFENSEFCLSLICLLGGLTAFFGASVGIFQYDIKKIIAYSTCSQLGYMFYACGTSNYELAIFHLFNHAFFKALLFLSAGSVIHALKGEQDIRRMGGLYKDMPFTCICMLVGSLSLIGFPFFSGFYSKDLILETGFFAFNPVGSFSYLLILVSIFMSSFYSARLVYFVFYPLSSTLDNTSDYLWYKNLIVGFTQITINQEPGLFMLVPLFILSILSIINGYLFHDMVAGLGSDFWINSINRQFFHLSRIDSEYAIFYIKLVPTVVSFLGCITSFILHFYYPSYIYDLYTVESIFKHMFIFINKKWFFDFVYNIFIIKIFIAYYKVILNYIDRGFFEVFMGPRGINFFFKKIINTLSSFFGTGRIVTNIFHIIFGFIILFFICFYPKIFLMMLKVMFAVCCLYILFRFSRKVIIALIRYIIHFIKKFFLNLLITYIKIIYYIYILHIVFL